MWNKGDTPPLLVEVQTCTATLGISVAVYQKFGIQSTLKTLHYNFAYVPSEFSIIPQGHFLNYVHVRIIYNIQNLKTT